MAQGENRNGIGLALCKALTDLLKGTIEVESELNDYTQFTISLPALELDKQTTGLNASQVGNRRTAHKYRVYRYYRIGRYGH